MKKPPNDNQLLKEIQLIRKMLYFIVINLDNPLFGKAEEREIFELNHKTEENS